MFEVEINNYDFGIKIYLNGIPELNIIPLDILNIFISILEKDISSSIDKN